MFDFDAASAAWRENKISQENGTFTYKCKVPNCKRACHVYSKKNKNKKFKMDLDIGMNDVCTRHILLISQKNNKKMKGALLFE